MNQFSIVTSDDDDDNNSNNNNFLFQKKKNNLFFNSDKLPSRFTFAVIVIIAKIMFKTE